MLCKDLKVVNLSITEDHYEYKGMFRLCSDEKCLDVNLAEFDEGFIHNENRESFGLEEDDATIKQIIMDKIMDATSIESRIVEGKDFNSNPKTTDMETKINTLNRA